MPCHITVLHLCIHAVTIHAFKDSYSQQTMYLQPMHLLSHTYINPCIHESMHPSAHARIHAATHPPFNVLSLGYGSDS